MPIQGLVDYFNDRFEFEHRTSFHPFILENGVVSGLFGPIKIDSYFNPLRQTTKPTAIFGQVAQISVSTRKIQHLYPNEIENLLLNERSENAIFDSFINFDRLARTVHMLNFLTQEGVLFLEVDPRHVLGVKEGHGAYFEEVLNRCSLETADVVIMISVHYRYALYYQELLKGLQNYRQRNYGIALKFETLNPDNKELELINTIEPDYVSISARSLGKAPDINLLKLLLQGVKATGGDSILQHIDAAKAACIAGDAGFDWVEGSYYRALPFSQTAKKNQYGRDLRWAKSASEN
jgi:hypothetical protein